MKSTGRVLNLGYALVSSSLAKKDSCGRCVSENVSSDGFAAVGAGEEGVGAGVALDLVGLSTIWGK